MEPNQQVYYRFKDVKHSWFLYSATNYDSHVYHQGTSHPDCGQWSIEPVPPHMMDDSSRKYYHIKDKRHGRYLVAGRLVDGNVYHMSHDNLKNGMWSITPAISPTNGIGGFIVADASHGRCLAAGVLPDNNTYHQEIQKSLPLEQLWHIETITEKVPAEDYPDFFIKPGSFRVIKVDSANLTEKNELPHSMLLSTFENGLTTTQRMKVSRSITTTTSQSLTTELACRDELSASINAEIKAGFFGGEVSIGTAISTTSAQEHRESKTHVFTQEYKFEIQQEIEVPPMTTMEAILEYRTVEADIPYTAMVEYALLTSGDEPKAAKRQIKGTWHGTTLTSYQVKLKNTTTKL